MEKTLCNQEISIAELFDAVMTLKSDKVPGIDGLTVEFYRKFWKSLSPFLMAMNQYSFKDGLFPESVRQGLITLLPKKNRDSRYIKNKRPLTLQNNDLKILSKALDNRLCEIIPNIISNDQNGFVRLRKICYNIRKSLDVIEYTKQIPGLILSIDMEKCFDRISHDAIIGSLKYYNFGDNSIKWVTLIYTRFQICVQNYGKLSRFWTKGQGTNQGDPLSPGLYLLTAEIMANKLRNHPGISGIKVNNVHYLLSQFADDTDMYLLYDQTIITYVFRVLSDVEMNTGLRISYEKTTMYRIGSLANSNAKLITPRKVNWSNECINTLGIDIGNDKKVLRRNFECTISKM